MSIKLIKNWSVPNSNFYPYSIHSVGDNMKTVLIIPGEQEVYTLVIKNLTEIIESDGMPHKVSSIKLTTNLVDTTVTVSNTIGLAENGKMVMFNSFRECVTVEGASGIKAIYTTQNDNRLFLLRLIDEDCLLLEVINNFSIPEITQPSKIYDLSWERSDIKASRNSQLYKIGVFLVRKENLRYFQRFLNCADLVEGTEIILFTVDGGLHWLKDTEDSYEIISVRHFAARINDFSFACSTNCFSVILENATLKVFCLSEDTDRLLIDEFNIYLGDAIEAYEFVSNSSMIIYSNGSQITQLRYFYSELSRSIQKESTNFQLAGVVGITYLEFAKVALCITENRFFYSVPITSINRFDDTKRDEYFELTSELLTQAKQMTCYLTNEVDIGKRIASSIDHEQLKLDILTSISTQSLYKNSIQSKLIFHNSAPARTQNSIWIGNSAIDTNIFAEVSISFQNKVGETLMRHRQWNLVLTSSTDVIQIRIEATSFFESNRLRLIHPIDGKSLKQQGLPTFQINLISVIDHFLDCILLEIPIKLNYNKDTAHLFDVTSSKSKCSISTDGSDLQSTIRSLISHCEQKPISICPSIEYCFNQTRPVQSVSDFLSFIGINKLANQNQQDIQTVYVHIGHHDSEVTWNAERAQLSLKTTAPGMLKELKMLYNEKLEHSETTKSDVLKAIQLRLLQCDFQRENIIAFYRQLRAPRM